MTSLALNRIDGSGLYAVDPARAGGWVFPGLCDAFASASQHLGAHLRILPRLTALLREARLVSGIGPARLQLGTAFGFGFRGLSLRGIGLAGGKSGSGRRLLGALHTSDALSTSFGISPRSLLWSAAVFASAPFRLWIGSVGGKGGDTRSLGFGRDVALGFGVSCSDFRQSHKFGIRSLSARGEIAQDATSLDADATVHGNSGLFRFASIGLGVEYADDRNARFDLENDVGRNDRVESRVAMTPFGSRLVEMLSGTSSRPDADIERSSKIRMAWARFCERVEIDGHVIRILVARGSFIIVRNCKAVKCALRAPSLGDLFANHSFKKEPFMAIPMRLG